MKKLILSLLISSLFISNVCATSSFESVSENTTSYVDTQSSTDYSSRLELKNGDFLLVFDESVDEQGQYEYAKLYSDGSTESFYSEYKIIGVDNYDNFITVQQCEVLSTEYERMITVPKFGLLSSDFSLLLQPIISNYSIYPEVFAPEYDNYGIAKVYYDCHYYSLDDKYLAAFNIHVPHNPKQGFLTSNGELITDYDEVYTDFITENRYLVKKDDTYSIINSNFETIISDFYAVKEIDFGKFYIATSLTDEQPVFDTIIDLNGQIISDFDINNNEVFSDWAEYYIYHTPYTIADGFSQTFEGLDYNFYTENISRIAFCKLIVNFLESKEYDLPEITDFDIFSDTKDTDILIAQKLGIINGTFENIFSPYENLTRQQAAAIIYRFCDVLNISFETVNEPDYFADYNEFSDYATQAILSLSALDSFDGYKVLAGVYINVFSPDSNLTLEQAITALVRLYNI